MLRILVAGAGHIGQLIAELLAASGDYRVTVVDRDELVLARLRGVAGVDTLCASVTDRQAMAGAMQGCFAVISAAPYAVTGAVAEAAHAAGVHYLDLTEDVATTRLVKTLAVDASRSAAWRRASSRSSAWSSPGASMRSIRCGCGSARCRSSRRTRSATT